jgi:hypothetical protein
MGSRFVQSRCGIHQRSAGASATFELESRVGLVSIDHKDASPARGFGFSLLVLCSVVSCCVLTGCSNPPTAMSLVGDSCAVYAEGMVRVRSGHSTWGQEVSEIQKATKIAERAAKLNNTYQNYASLMREASASAQTAELSADLKKQIWDVCSGYVGT